MQAKVDKIVVAMLITVIASVMITVVLLLYYCRDVRFVTEFLHDDKDITLQFDGKIEPISAFIDSSPTSFYRPEERGYIERRILLLVSDERMLIPPCNLLVISRMGIGVVGCTPFKREILGMKVLAFKPMMDSAYDVRDEMKGLDAIVETNRNNDYVEYKIYWRKHGDVHIHKIVLRISTPLHDLISRCAVAETQQKTTEQGPAE